MDDTKFCKDCQRSDFTSYGELCRRAPEVMCVDLINGNKYPSNDHLLCRFERCEHSLVEKVFRFFEKEYGRTFCGPEGRFFVQKNN